MTNSTPDVFLALNQSATWIEANASWWDVGVPPTSVTVIAGHILCVINAGLPRPPVDGLPARVLVYTDPGASHPLAHGGAGPSPDVATIRVTVGGTYWCQLIYQFSHELGHIVSNSWGERWSPGTAHMWLEEACCGALSLLALDRMAGRWADYDIFGDAAYAQSIRDYSIQRHREFTELGSLDPDHLLVWWADNASALAVGESLNDINKPLAALLYGWMRDHPTLWHDMRALNHWPRPERLSLSKHLAAWEEWCRRLGTAGELPRRIGRHFLPWAETVQGP